MAAAKRTRSKKTSDRISGLPECLRESILMCLPTRDAVRTSVLSRTWRYSWCSIPVLMISVDTVPKPRRFPTQADFRKKLVDVLFQILLLHQGPILKFELVVPCIQGFPRLDNVIVHLSRSRVEEFVLELEPGIRYYKMPSSFFSFKSLRSLTLRACSIAPPLSFNGFSQLVSMCLDTVNISAEAFARLLAHCPLLEKLDLTIRSLYRTGGVPAKLAPPLNRLLHLTLNTPFMGVGEGLDLLLCLLRSSPNLLDLELTVYRNDDRVIMQDTSDITMGKLQEVKLEIGGTWVGNQLIEFLLKSSPNLEVMVMPRDLWKSQMRRKSRVHRTGRV